MYIVSLLPLQIIRLCFTQEQKEVVSLIDHKPIENFNFEDLHLLNDTLLVGKYKLKRCYK